VAKVYLSLPTITHPAFGSAPVRYAVTYLPDDAEGQVAGTIELMRGYVREDADTDEIGNDVVRALGSEYQSVGADVSPLTDKECISRVWKYVRNRMSFVEDDTLTNQFNHQDPEAPIVEALIRPVDLSVMGKAGGNRVGDCDDHSMYVAAMLRRLGIRCAFVTVAADSQAPGQMSHVYVAAYTRDGQRIAVDASHGPYCGWETPDATRMQEWQVDKPGLLDMIGVGAIVYFAARQLGYV